MEPLPDDDAAVLFVERASAVAPGFRPGAAVSEICRRLDGLQLAIELAAARVALLVPDELLARLDRRLPLLASRSRDAPARQRTLRATIEWSYELLTPEEQELFRRLAVFPGSFSLDAAEAVSGASLDALESLVVKSLVRRWGSGRLGMLDTIREYAAELLDASPDAYDVYRRHADHFRDVADEANLNAGNRRPGGRDWKSGSRSGTTSAAPSHGHCAAIPSPSASRSRPRWSSCGRSRIRRRASVVQATVRAAGGRACLAEPTRRGLARLRQLAGGIAGHWAAAEELWSQSLALFEELDDEHGRAVLMHRLGIVAAFRGELARPRELVEASHEIHGCSGDVFGRAQTTGTLGAIRRDEGDERSAMQLVRESVVLAREAGVPWWESGALAELASVSLNAELLDEGEAHARESLALADRLHDRPGRISESDSSRA